MNEMQSPAESQEPYVMTRIPEQAVSTANCSALRNHFPFMWKICLCYGICYLLFAYNNSDGIGSGIFAAVSAIFLLMIAKHLINHLADREENTTDFTKESKKLSIKISFESLFYYGAAVLISFSNCLTDSFFFLFFNHVGSFLLFSIACIKLFYNDKKWDFGKYFCTLFAFLFQVLEALPIPFRDWRSYAKQDNKKMSPTKRYVLIGIAAGLPILMITTLLLASADQIFSDLLKNLFNLDELGKWLTEGLAEHMVLLPLGFIIYTLLLYLVVGTLCKGELKEDVTTPAQFGTPIAVTIFSMIDFVYVIFCGIQFLFLFAGIPTPARLYAEYARKGFFELLFVALINFLLVLFCNKHFAKNAALKVTMTITCVCTFVMIVSSAFRMYMYIDAYHLTFLRVFVLWFLLLLAFFMVGTTISIYKTEWNSFRYCLVVLTCMYTLFAISGTDIWIGKYNVGQFEKYIQADNQPSLKDYLPSNYKSSLAYAPALSALMTNHHEELSEDNIDLIYHYFTLYDHFYIYDYAGNYVLDHNTAIYDTNESQSVFMWKHFNFIENICYKKCSSISEY